MQSDTELYYDLLAERIADEWYEETVLMPTIQDFVSLLPQKPRILDLGCGPGHESLRLASTGAQVVGIDFSSESIRIARERAPHCQFAVMDFRQLDGRFGKFDGVFASGSLIHISPEEMPDVLKKVAQILRENGYLLAIVQDGEGTRERWPVVAGKKLKRVIYLYTKESLKSAASQFSFVREGYLAPSLTEHGWRCYVFKIRT
ncbi:MAG: class I SAM-dependent methyltransferase [Anaerolineae bacterium]|nr:MAG: class I SAM-dependent methyltransferase [Anaerolineae bacterium]